ncbi:glutamic acid-rich protein-like [Trifolium pratense]|uniref:Uncharacterized protein n=1 Tax=Trifolium pratense TaxID=57577 RepID=A0ACB0LSR3_TRIPR|nr:glutamic acid-rich protein-like [Trifolium pratense]XP_045798606.1 glutamic acid-rich protein-like [Trifolium pratense]CAJ2671144.1 unnamed protein product [Trifolium pratense]
MAGKGRKRREKNYRAAHGGSTALPPPPKSSQLDALPFKLRQIISFTKHQNDSPVLSKDKKLDQGHAQNEDTSEPLKAPECRDEQLNANDDNKNKKKRKRKEVKDLRFAMEEDKTNSQLKKKERKKKYEAKKKKHKKVEEDEILDFPGQEKIKFGDIVQAPPKLSYIPKAFKISQDASHERLRLRAIENYRSRKGWTSRPGNHRPPPVTTEDP